MNEIDQQLISAYLLEDLPPAARAGLEKRLAAEPELARELTAQQQLRTYLSTQAQRPALEAKMAELSASFREQATETSVPQAKVRRFRPWMGAVGAAAAIALLLIVFNPFAQPDLYEQYAQHQPLSLVEKGDAEVSAQAAQTAFNAGNYPEAYTALNLYLEAAPDDVQARLALGIAALESGRGTEAIAIFSELASGSTALQTAGQFYLGLAYLKTGDQARAQEAMEGVAASHPDYGPKAREILQALPTD